MPTLTYNKNGWKVIDLRYLTYYEKQRYISYFMNHKEYIWMEFPKDNVIKWRKLKNEKIKIMVN